DYDYDYDDGGGGGGADGGCGARPLAHLTDETGGESDSQKLSEPRRARKGAGGGGGGGGGSSTNPLSEASSAIETENNGLLVDVPCGSGYPFVTSNYTIYPLLCGFCRRIDKHNDYTWVSRDQQIGPEDGLTGGYFIRVIKEEGEPEELPPEKEGDPKRTIKRYIYTIDTVSLVVAGEKKMSPKEHEEYLKKKGVDIPEEGSSKGCDPPNPWLLDKSTGYKDRLRFIGVVYKDTKNDLPFWSTFFADPPKRIMAYAQAQVYNHLAEDTFTQDWRVRLERASLLESFIQKKGKDTGMGKKNFASDFLNTVNNH
ncbi:MAG: hypothetical protein KAG70_12125, partial [Alcanivorax sp.]|nr:hypothetical protein [Alcanivorax sp.]